MLDQQICNPGCEHREACRGDVQQAEGVHPDPPITRIVGQGMSCPQRMLLLDRCKESAEIFGNLPWPPRLQCCEPRIGAPAVPAFMENRNMIGKTLIAAAALALAMTGAGLAQSTAPTDPQIAHIAYTAGQFDIAAAEQAIRKSKNQDIIDFAGLIAADHKAVNHQAVALVARLGVTPEDNATSEALSKAAADKLAELDTLD